MTTARRARVRALMSALFGALLMTTPPPVQAEPAARTQAGAPQAMAMLAAPATTAEAIAAPTCAPGALCPIGVRSYRYQAPPDWDGATPLPVLIHFHGRKRNSGHVLKNPKVAGPAADLGVLLVAPDGLDGDWAFRGADPSDVAFTDAIVADLARHISFDRSRVFLSGFSNGAAMASRIACERGDAFAGYLPIAGHLRDAQPWDCAGGLSRVLQVHGRTDVVYKPPLGAEAAGDFAFWRNVAACAGPPSERRAFHVYECRTWSRCAGRAEVGVCLHKYGHILPKSWLPFALAHLLERAPAPPVSLRRSSAQ